MKNLKHIILEEMDGLEWMDNIKPDVRIFNREQLSIGDRVKVIPKVRIATPYKTVDTLYDYYGTVMGFVLGGIDVLLDDTLNKGWQCKDGGYNVEGECWYVTFSTSEIYKTFSI